MACPAVAFSKRRLAGAGGFEPPMPVPKTGALPLGYAPTFKFIDKCEFYSDRRFLSYSAILLYSSITPFSTSVRVSAFKGCTMSLKVPSFLRREGIDTNRPLSPSMIFKSRIIKLSSNTKVAYAFRRPPLSTGNTLTSVIFISDVPIRVSKLTNYRYNFRDNLTQGNRKNQHTSAALNLADREDGFLFNSSSLAVRAFVVNILKPF